MKFLITGEHGFIGKNLIKTINKSKEHTIIETTNLLVNPAMSSQFFWHPEVNDPKKESLCVRTNTFDAWAQTLNHYKIDVIIHNAAIVGTDVVALDPKNAVKTNVGGTFNIAQAAKVANIPICYFGTTVIYDTDKYQDEPIVEDSIKAPKTLYGEQKLAGEDIVKNICKDWLIIRPLFAYGGLGDMNSLMAKTTFAALKNKKIDMFLDPDKIKDYMHVEDFCSGVIAACAAKLWGNDFNIAAENPLKTSEIIEIIDSHASDIGIKTKPSELLSWHPETDYLGNHRLSSQKFREAIGDKWKPKYTIEEGIKKSMDEIKAAVDKGTKYDPLVYLDEAKEKKIDLKKFYE